jgi:hypothetical protein
MSIDRKIWIFLVGLPLALFCWFNVMVITEHILWKPGVPVKTAGVAKFVADRFTFTEKSKSMPGSPPISFLMDSWLGHVTLVVYTITDRKQQDQILDLVRQYRQQPGVGTILVKFYREENWRTWEYTNGGGGGARGPEELLRTERVR